MNVTSFTLPPTGLQELKHTQACFRKDTGKQKWASEMALRKRHLLGQPGLKEPHVN